MFTHPGCFMDSMPGSGTGVGCDGGKLRWDVIWNRNQCASVDEGVLCVAAILTNSI